MTSSGIKRSLAVSAISALAVAGLPLLAGSAQAIENADQMNGNVYLLSQGITTGDDNTTYQTQTITDVNDGTNTTASLVAGGPDAVTSIFFEYSVAGANNWNAIGTVQGRNADGVFETEWAIPDTLNGQSVDLRATPNTGVANAAIARNVPVSTDPNDAIELGTEGNLGIYQNEITHKDNVAVRGTVSKDFTQPTVNVFDVTRKVDDSEDVGISPAVKTNTDGSKYFEGVLQYDNNGDNDSNDAKEYPYSTGTDLNQAVLGAAGNLGEDTEASTYYIQQVSSVTATPKQNPIAGGTTPVTVTVTDQNGKPVAGATIGLLTGTDDPNTAGDQRADQGSQGTTDANGMFTQNKGVGTYTYYVDDDATPGHSAGDKDAASFTITSYTPGFNAIDIVNERNRSNFDQDELGDGDDFTIVTKDQNGNGIAAPIEYRYIIDPSGTGDTVTGDWHSGEMTNGQGEYAVPGLPLPANDGISDGNLVDGSYTLEARRPNVSGTGLTNADPENFKVSESDISYDEGASANAPVNGDFTVNGNLGNDDGGLAGRQVNLTYAGANNTAPNDAGFAPQSAQPAGVTVTSGSTATAKTDANGDFAVVLRDPAIPPNVTPHAENGTLNAIAQEAPDDATSLQGNTGPDDSTVANDTDNAEQDLRLHFITQPTVDSITVTPSLDWGNGSGDYNPGELVHLDIRVKGTDNDTNPANNPDLQDFPVTVTVDHGYLTPDDRQAAAGQGDAGDEVGVWEDLGQTEDISSGDNAKASIDTSIGRDAGFDDDGIQTAQVTVTAGGKSQTATVTWNSDAPLNGESLEIVPMAGEPQGTVSIGQTVKHNVFAKDQFGNLVGSGGGFGGNQILVSDNTTDAGFNTDFLADYALPDFTNSSWSIEAYGQNPTSQTITGLWQTASTTFGANSAVVTGSKNVTAQAPTINWVNGTTGGKIHPSIALHSHNNGAKADRLRTNGPTKAAGATVRFQKKVNGHWKLIATKTANKYGNVHTFSVKDTNGRAYTKYRAKYGPTAKTTRAHSNAKRVR